MKFFVVLMILVAGGLAAETYTNRFDDVNIDTILQNKRALTAYIKCMMDEGPCTREGKELKAILPDALANGCSKCTEKQKAATEKVINHLKKNQAANWSRLIAKYDPKGEYESRFAASQQTKKH